MREIETQASGIDHAAGLFHVRPQHGAQGRVQQMRFVLDRTDAAIRELEAKRAHIEASLAELRVINASVKQALEARNV